jgi:hypothetical protein
MWKLIYPGEITPGTSDNACLSPEYAIAYPYKVELSGGTPTPFPPVFTFWEPILKNTLPDDFRPGDGYLFGRDDSLIVEPNGNIWVLGYYLENESIHSQVLRVSNDYSKVARYDVAEDVDATVILSDSYLSDDGVLWLFGSYVVDPNNYRLYIAYYDRNLDEFRSVSNLDDSPVALVQKPPDKPSVYSNVVADSRGNFWFVVFDSLMKFIPSSQELTEEEVNIKIQNPAKEEVRLDNQSLIIDDQDQLWTMAKFQYFDKDGRFAAGSFHLMSYNTFSGRVSFHGSPPGLEDIRSMGGHLPNFGCFKTMRARHGFRILVGTQNTMAKMYGTN